jgi:hypothetical protein
MINDKGEEAPLPGKTGDRIIEQGGSVLMDSPGAGGWGK